MNKLRYELLAAATKDGKIVQQLQQEFNGVRDQLSSWMLDTRDHSIKQALCQLGWTPPGALMLAFVEGASWWEWHKEGATMWPSDRDLAEEEALRRKKNGTLGGFPFPDDNRPVKAGRNRRAKFQKKRLKPQEAGGGGR